MSIHSQQVQQGQLKGQQGLHRQLGQFKDSKFSQDSQRTARPARLLQVQRGQTKDSKVSKSLPKMTHFSKNYQFMTKNDPF